MQRSGVRSPRRPPTPNQPMPNRSESQPGEFPECVAVGSRFTDGRIVWGASGVLIYPNLVLTAHHALRMNPNVVAIDTVSVGSSRRVVPIARHDWPQWAELLPHPSLNDLAVLVLQHAIGHVTPAKLPDEHDILQFGDAVEIVGFGRRDRKDASGFGTQRKGVVTVAVLYDGEFAAGGPGQPDTCIGDSGGPAYALARGGRRLVGITSRSVEPEDCGAGGIYTSVTRYASFLERIRASYVEAMPK